jgi:predicted Ser/Thr protein kinase
VSSVQYLIGKTLGKYQILEHIGHGGMSEVYKGQQAQLNRMVAIKVLHPFLADEEGFVVRFQREARLVAAMRHPNIVQVYDFDYHDELAIYYMVMEYIDGPTLKNLLEGGPISTEDTVHVGSAIADALDYAHQRSMIHRDIKPANIMYLDDKEPVLTDFGIARMLNLSGLTASGAMVGTPAYMAPEIGIGKAGAASSDIYSLSVVLYQAVTGNLPFAAETPMGMVMDHISKPPPRPSIFAPTVSKALEQVILKGMQKEPSARFRTAGEMAVALRQVLGPAHVAPPAAVPVLASEKAQAVGPLPPTAVAQSTGPKPNEHEGRTDSLTELGGDGEAEGLQEADDWLAKSWSSLVAAAAKLEAENEPRPEVQPRRTFRRLLRAPTAWLLILLVVGLAGTSIWYALGGNGGSLAQELGRADTAGAVLDRVATTAAMPSPTSTATAASAGSPSGADPSPSPVWSPTLPPDCTLRGRVEHVNIQPNKRVGPLTSLMAYVTLRNTGTCAWLPGAELLLTGVGPTGISDCVPLRALDPGEIMQILCPLSAPAELGTYPITVEMRDAAGRSFGSPVKVEIIVDELQLQASTPVASLAMVMSTPQPLAMKAPILLEWEDQPAQNRWIGIVELFAEGGTGTYRYYQDEIREATEIVDGRIRVVGSRCDSVILNLWVLSGNQSIYVQEKVPFPAAERCW